MDGTSTTDAFPPTEAGPAERARSETSEAYLQLGEVGTTKQSNLLEQWISGCSYRAASRGLLAHCWAMFRQRGAERVPIPCRAMQRQLEDCPRKTEKVWRPLEESGVLLVEESYSSALGECREFQLAPWAAQELAEAGLEGKPRQRKLSSGERYYGSRPVYTMRISQENGNDWHWDLLTESLEILKEARHVVNYAAAEKALEKLRERAEEAQARYEAHSSDEAEEALKEAQGRYASALACMRTIDNQTFEELPKGRRLIRNAYEVQTLSGRLTFKSGGPQSLPRALKAALYDLPGIYNYDIKGSQTWCLRYLAKELREVGVKVDTAPLDDYLDRGGKDWIVETHNLPRKLVGRVEHAVKFGALLPTSLAQARAIAQGRKKTTGRWKLPDVVEHIKEFYSTDEKVDAVIRAFYGIFEDTMEMVREMAEALVGEYWDENKQPGGRGMGWHMRNACEITFTPHDWEEGHERRSKAMAWYLQGLEAAFVHAITALSKRHLYEVLANEHDGLITRGEIPTEAIENAREMSGFERAEFIVKPLAGEDELEELSVRLKHTSRPESSLVA